MRAQRSSWPAGAVLASVTPTSAHASNFFRIFRCQGLIGIGREFDSGPICVPRDRAARPVATELDLEAAVPVRAFASRGHRLRRSNLDSKAVVQALGGRSSSISHTAGRDLGSRSIQHGHNPTRCGGPAASRLPERACRSSPKRVLHRHTVQPGSLFPGSPYEDGNAFAVCRYCRLLTCATTVTPRFWRPADGESPAIATVRFGASAVDLLKSF